MRRWLLLAMILLLPLRGLVGDAMAAGMLQQHVRGPAAADAGHHRGPAGHHAQAALHDCDGPGHHAAGHAAAAAHSHAAAHARDAAPEPQAADAATPGECPTCATCQVCSSVALQPVVPTTSAEQAVQPRPMTAERAPPSAEAALAFKPPRG